MIRIAVLLIFFSLIGIQSAQASPESRDSYIANTKQSYIPNAKAVADGNKDIVQSKINTAWDGDEPLFYGGNDPAAIAAVQASDYEKILTSDFLDCVELEPIGFCYDDGVIVGLKIRYRWPMQVVHTHNFWQNRYIPNLAYQAYKNIGYLENIFYPMVNNVIMPQTIGFGGYRAWQDALELGHAINPNSPVSPGDTDLARAPEESRYTGGVLGTAGHLEYSVVPTTMQLAWEAISAIFPILKVIPCAPPTQRPMPFTSEDPENIEMTRNWMLYTSLYKEIDLQNDMAIWRADPSACTRYNMSQTQGNIPFNMYNPDASTGSTTGLSHPALFTPMSPAELDNYKGVCTKNWGATLPYTTVESVNAHDIVHAGINLEKALRYAWGKYLSFMRTSDFPRDSNGFKIANPDNWKNQAGLAQYSAYYPLDKEKDKIQYIYHDRVPRECRRVGDPAPKFPGADQLRKPGEAGLYSIVHWKHFECCAGFF